MNEMRTALQRYFEILEEKTQAQYLRCKHIAVSFMKKDSTERLWEKHDHALQSVSGLDTKPKQSLLDLKIELANRVFLSCCFCERRCSVDRRKTVGDCGVKEPKIVSAFLHLGEEPMLVPSYTVFFSGCTFHCVFCQNWDISQQNIGTIVEPRHLAATIEKQEGAKNVNWVGGDPTSNLLHILQTLQYCETNLPQIWNSNMYCSFETMKLLHGIIDVYLTDFKYGNDQCAQRLSKVQNYTNVVKRNHTIAYQQGEMIIRHLILPNHTTCCSKPVIKWIAQCTPHALVNIMAQYRPEYKAMQENDIKRSLTAKEFLIVKQFADELNINQVS